MAVARAARRGGSREAAALVAAIGAGGRRVPHAGGCSSLGRRRPAQARPRPSPRGAPPIGLSSCQSGRRARRPPRPRPRPRPGQMPGALLPPWEGELSCRSVRTGPAGGRGRAGVPALSAPSRAGHLGASLSRSNPRQELSGSGQASGPGKLSLPSGARAWSGACRKGKGAGRKARRETPRGTLLFRVPTTGYMIFLNKQRSQLRATHPDLPFTEIMKMLAVQWAQLSQDKKGEMNSMTSTAGPPGSSSAPCATRRNLLQRQHLQPLSDRQARLLWATQDTDVSFSWSARSLYSISTSSSSIPEHPQACGHLGSGCRIL
nr:translation initiation factor IF-2-like [Pan troglodytes]